MAGSAGAADAVGYRPLLFSIAYGMTGSVGDAEDLVQDTFLNLTRARRSGTAITNLKAYLTTSVTRLGINHLDSARVRRETYVGQWLPEPVVAFADRPDGPAEHAELTDALSMAFLVMLEALSPVERAVFVLREALGYGYPEVAELTGKSEANCRQILTRARKRLALGADAPLPPTRRAEGDELARRFFEVAAGGDLEELLGMLAPDVVLHGDGGGKAQAIGRSVDNPRQVAQLLVSGLRRIAVLGASLVPARVNGRPGVVAYDGEGRVLNVVALDFAADGTVREIHAVANPDKLGHLGEVSDLGLRRTRQR
ncbi:RNA polymerase sigma factor SigJ [Streptomyces sp. FH025]|uniref:RNA polymerase sigma factor SigJ n=1 Tax=Streptomyces sp. FH025 TaxID=2815937 RepID=UPI001A9F590E|nr:RNA polymerase sigma factor SigJ [Streptomyces sp. FH025]MBO1413044.1 RNA polymerase sigma factor SigJ [Streptomyces sp. FH025]